MTAGSSTSVNTETCTRVLVIYHYFFLHRKIFYIQIFYGKIFYIYINIFYIQFLCRLLPFLAAISCSVSSFLSIYIYFYLFLSSFVNLLPTSNHFYQFLLMKIFMCHSLCSLYSLYGLCERIYYLPQTCIYNNDNNHPGYSKSHGGPFIYMRFLQYL